MLVTVVWLNLGGAYVSYIIEGEQLTVSNNRLPTTAPGDGRNGMAIQIDSPGRRQRGTT